MKNIIIIGAGISGTLLTINLIKRVSKNGDCKIVIIDRYDDNYLGPAYSSNEEGLLLNVPACKMGAFSSQPGHFTNWLHKNGRYTGDWSFMPRKLYGDYIRDVYNQALSENKYFEIDRLKDEVIDMETTGNQIRVIGRNHVITADKVVLALGTFPPRNLPLRKMNYVSCHRYFQVPWYDGMFDSLSANEQVILIGTGQTTVDVLVRLKNRNHKGRIIAISRHGLFPSGHTAFKEYPAFFDEIKDLNHVVDIFHVIRKHFLKAKSLGFDNNEVLDSLRPFVQDIWIKLPLSEKQSFLRHLFRYYEIIRSRIPSESYLLVEQMKKSGQLVVVQGKIKEIHCANDKFEVRVDENGKNPDSFLKTIPGSLIVNCIGPLTNYSEIEQPFIRNTIERGIIEPDPLKLGIMTTLDGAIISRSGNVAGNVFTLGFPMRGILWEVLAVPEIRVQAEKLAEKILH